MKTKIMGGNHDVSVAQSLREILHKQLTDNDVNCMAVVLICHLMIENKINCLLFKWMSLPIPHTGKGNNEQTENFTMMFVSRLTKI